ncbi:MAG TPA: 5-deoxy-glucuronate isomerase, partial [Actinomycetota bacterium]|nr:5-deoxy-glucuronate isomerase [Actinomycetota bacterium]
MTKLHLRQGDTADGAWSLVVTPEQAGWGYSGLRVLELAPGAAHEFATGGDELLVLPMEGAGVVQCESRRFELAGRDGVFAGVSDFAYVPRDAEVRVSSSGGG